MIDGCKKQPASHSGFYAPAYCCETVSWGTLIFFNIVGNLETVLKIGKCISEKFEDK